MTKPPDPAPCKDDEQLFECPECGARVCSSESVVICQQCDCRMENLTKPRVE